MMARLFRTAFFVCAYSFALFAFLDYLEPGVVSDVFSVYVWLLGAIVFGIAWAATDRTPSTSSTPLFSIAAMLFGLALAHIVWQNGEAFGDFRLLLALCSIAFPYVILRSS